MIGFFTCGFQIFFIAVHLPAYLVDRGLPAEIGGWTLGVIGLFNMVGAIAAGWLSTFMPKRYLLSFIYFARALAILVYIMLPPSAAATLIFGAVLGLLWLSTALPTSGLVTSCSARTGLPRCSDSLFSAIRSAVPRRMARRRVVRARWIRRCRWWLAILSGLFSAAINLPIVEKPVRRLAAASA